MRCMDDHEAIIAAKLRGALSARHHYAHGSGARAFILQAISVHLRNLRSHRLSHAFVQREVPRG